MKTNLQKLFLLAIILLTPNRIQAASSCSYSEQAELNSIVANVKATYEVIDVYKGTAIDIDGDLGETDYYEKGFKISVLNVTDDIYVQITNGLTQETKTYKNADTDNGTITFESQVTDQLVKYTINVYSNKYSCAGQLFRTLEVTTPIYNWYSQLAICAENPGYYYCQEFINTAPVSTEYFYENIAKYQKETEEAQEQQANENKNFIDKLKDFYNNNKLIIYSIGIVIVVAGVATTVILIKKKRSRVL